MLTAILFSLAAGSPASVLPATTVQDYEPQIRVRLNKERGIDRGDRIRVYTRSEADGYLIVLHADPDGRVRVLFPLDPGDDNFVRGDREYEIRGRGDRHAFTVYQSSGRGTVYAAFSRDPLAFGEFVLGDHWDYTLPEWVVGPEADAGLTDLVSRMVSADGFDYDLYEYDIGDRVAYERDHSYHLSLYDPYYYPGHYRSGFSIRIGFGGFGFYRGYYDPFYWDPFWGYPYWRHRNAFYYDPFYYDPYYYYDPYFPTDYWYRGYAAPRRRVYVANPGIGSRRYTFKSDTDRWGIRPDVIRPRRRSGRTQVAANTGTAPSRRNAPAAGAPTRRAEPANTIPRRIGPSSTPARGAQAPTRRGTAERPAAGSPGNTTRRLIPRETPTRERQPLIDRGRSAGSDTPRRTTTSRRETPAAAAPRPERSGTERRAAPTRRDEPATPPRAETTRRRSNRSALPRTARPSEQAPARSSTTRRTPVTPRAPTRSGSSAPSRSAQPTRTTRSSGGTARPRSAARPAARPSPRAAPTRSARPSSRPAPSRPSRPSRSARPAPPRSNQPSSTRSRPSSTRSAPRSTSRSRSQPSTSRSRSSGSSSRSRSSGSSNRRRN